MNLCVTHCGRPTRDTLALCNGCLWALECDLGDVAWLDEQLELVLSRLAVVGEHNGGRSAETPMPVHPGALKARSDLRAALVGWVRDMLGEPIEGPTCGRCGHGSCAQIAWYTWPEDTMPAMAAWLLNRINRIAIHPAAEDIHGEIVSAVRFAARVIDLPANRTTFPVGPCPELGCQGEIRAYIPAQPERPARMECSACETRWEPHQWLRAGRRILARKGEAIGYVDVQVAAQSMGVSGQTIRNWMLSGKLTNHGTANKFMVDLTELLRVMDAVA